MHDCKHCRHFLALHFVEVIVCVFVGVRVCVLYMYVYVCVHAFKVVQKHDLFGHTGQEQGATPWLEL